MHMTIILLFAIIFLGIMFYLNRGKNAVKHYLLIAIIGGIISVLACLFIEQFSGTAWMRMKTATPTDMMGSITARSVKRITRAPISTTTQPSTSSSICRFTALWLRESPSRVKKAAHPLTTTPTTANRIIPS